MSHSNRWVHHVWALSHKMPKVSLPTQNCLSHKQIFSNTRVALRQGYMSFSHSISSGDSHENTISSIGQNSLQIPTATNTFQTTNNENNSQHKPFPKRKFSVYVAGALLLVSGTYGILGYFTMNRYDVIERPNESMRNIFLKYFPLSEFFLDFLEEKYYKDNQMSYYQKQGLKGLNAKSTAHNNCPISFMSSVKGDDKPDYVYSYDEHETQGQKLYMKEEARRQDQQRSEKSVSDSLLHGRFFSMATGEANAKQKKYLPLILLPDDTNLEVNKLTMHLNDLITNFINNASIGPESTELPDYTKGSITKIINDLEVLALQARDTGNFSQVFKQASDSFKPLANNSHSVINDDVFIIRTKQDIANHILLVENSLVEYVNTKR
ncbi:hypothetical protein NADFUDRAFT_42660 [Nadsonia fulvescens var. elongata DSM 6958]|uniref:Mitofilin n=1 Tax=Nadsonia fulvescens var. elongata DSM 6958 TaxID=857566 RepID=A0A1E3PKB0_9ASCO|nr:hypothetical protein NADFUDRAFT_42660 [Nadsonia fulvescens var. elongata DSM 6958]